MKHSLEYLQAAAQQALRARAVGDARWTLLEMSLMLRGYTAEQITHGLAKLACGEMPK